MMINEKLHKWVKRLLITVFALYPAIMPAQLRVVDSLEDELNKPGLSQADRIATMLAGAEAYRQVDIEKAKQLGVKTLEAAKKYKDPQLEFKALMSLGVTLISSLEYSQALEYFIHAANICDTYQSDPAWRKRKAQALINMGGVYWSDGEFPKAKEYIQSSNAILKTLDEPVVFADNLVALGTIAEHLNELDEGLGYLTQAVEIYRQQNSQKGLAGAYSFIGDIYLEKKDSNKALHYKNLSLSIRKSLDSPRDLLKAYAGVGEAHLNLNNAAAAKPYLLKAASLAENTRDIESQNAIYRQLAECYERIAQPDSAIFYWKAYEQHIQDNYDKEKAKQLQKLENQYQTQQKKQEYALMKQKAESAQFRNTVLIFTNIFFAVLVALIIWFLTRIRYKNKQLAVLNQQLQEANEELLQTSTEKKFLTTLLAHDLRHPLTLIQLNLHELKTSGVSQSSDLLNEMETAVNKIEEMSRRIMDVENMGQGVSLSIELGAVNAFDTLCKSKAEFEPYAAKKHIAITLQSLSEGQSPLVKADPYFLNRVINNLLSNAIKYAPDYTVVNLDVKKEADRIQFLVADHGPGLDKIDQAKVFQQSQQLKPKVLHGEYSMGYGLFIAKRYVEAMGGSIMLNSLPGKGSTFIVELPAA